MAGRAGKARPGLDCNIDERNNQERKVLEGAKIKSSEVVLDPFVSASSSR